MSDADGAVQKIKRNHLPKLMENPLFISFFSYYLVHQRKRFLSGLFCKLYCTIPKIIYICKKIFIKILDILKIKIRKSSVNYVYLVVIVGVHKKFN